MRVILNINGTTQVIYSKLEISSIHLIVCVISIHHYENIIQNDNLLLALINSE